MKSLLTLLCSSAVFGAIAVHGAASVTVAPAAAPAVAVAAEDAATWNVAAPPPPGFDRVWAQRTTRKHLEQLVALDTTNPPGNEALTAQWFEDLLSGIDGIETHVLPAGEGRANFIARLRADAPTSRPMLVLGHMDVVGAQVDNWTTPPFTLTERDGYLFGRGAMDDKGMLAAAATAMLALAPRRAELSRDIILLATAAEEGGPAVGVDLVLEQHADLLGSPEFALNEGGRVRVVDGRIESLNVQVTEKIYYTVKARATGPSGHGSVPLPDNALAALARAVNRVHEWRPPVRLNETALLFFQQLSRLESDPGMRLAMKQLGSDDRATRIAAADELSDDPLYNAVLRTGCSLTMIDGGFRANVIPSGGEATFNVRIVPGDDIEAVVRDMQRVGGERSVRFELDGEVRTAPAPSPVMSPLFDAMESAASTMAPGVVAIPFMSTGATDGAALRAAGIPTYGILPFPMTINDELRMHGDDERVPVPALGWAAEFLYRVMDGVAG